MRIGHDVTVTADDKTGTLTTGRRRITAWSATTIGVGHTEAAEEFGERILRLRTLRTALLNLLFRPLFGDLHIDYGWAETLDQRGEVGQAADQRRTVGRCAGRGCRTLCCRCSCGGRPGTGRDGGTQQQHRD